MANGKLTDFYKPHDAVDFVPVGPSMTRQEFAEDCDINTIMERYERTGELPVNRGEPIYYDFTTVPGLQDGLHLMQEAERAFMTLPAKVRRDFDNDAVAFAQFAVDPANLEQMRDWGLAKPAEPAEAALSMAPNVAVGNADKPPAPSPAAPVAAVKEGA